MKQETGLVGVVNQDVDQGACGSQDLVEGDFVVIFKPSVQDVFLGELGKVQKVPAKDLSDTPVDPIIVVEIVNRKYTTVQCRRSTLRKVFG